MGLTKSHSFIFFYGGGQRVDRHLLSPYIGEEKEESGGREEE